jgi:transcriptional antiterminator NusG
MNYYVIQVKVRHEASFLELAGPIARTLDIALIWPRRSLRIRRKGRWTKGLVPVFPGYIFLTVDQFPPLLYWRLKNLPYFYRFLTSNTNINPIPQKEAQIINHLLKYGEIVRESVGTFDIDNKIVVVEGPLKGLEGCIVKIDKRKGRAKVKLNLYEESYLVDFGFFSLEKLRR